MHSFDSGSYCCAYGHVAVEAGRMLQEGASAAQIGSYLEEAVPRRKVYFGIYDLKYAGKSGRIPSAAAFVGDKLGIKPIMKIWDHEITTAAKCRGEKKLISIGLFGHVFTPTNSMIDNALNRQKGSKEEEPAIVSEPL